MISIGYDMIDCLPHTNLYTIEEVKKILSAFITKWKGCNFMRKGNIKINEYFSFSQLSAATAGKKKELYHLYRGLKCKQDNTVYNDMYPSSWSTNIDIAKRFGSKVILQTTVSYERVLLDLSYLSNDYEHEIILLPGKYNVTVLKGGLTKAKTKTKTKKVKPNLQNLLEIGIDNYELEFQLAKFTIPELKDICRTRKIVGYSNKKKAILISFMVCKLKA